MIFTPEMFKNRRKELAQKVKKPILLCGAFEQPWSTFRQDSTFFYFTGCEEPGLCCLIMPDGKTTVFVPCYAQSRAMWMGPSAELNEKFAERHGFDEIRPLGCLCSGYQVSLFDKAEVWGALSALLSGFVKDGSSIATPLSGQMQQPLWLKLNLSVPGLTHIASDCSYEIAAMRRVKAKEEIDALFRAGAVTSMAHQGATLAIKDGGSEADVFAGILYVFAQEGSREAFPSIVASGERGTILHYADAAGDLHDGECVVVDIGAQVDNYCADVTRTYPVSGSFSKRQREVYDAVLSTQQLLADQVKPGWWIRNDNCPELSLTHCAKVHLAEHGLAEYFTHGIGHFLGLDVHDVGDTAQPLQEGDVITIEPGVYLPKEKLGVRIEDDFWIVKNGAVCLTEDLPRTVLEIEKMMKDARKE